MSNKPIHVKPQFYAECMYALKEIAKEHGYNLVLHGSMQRDMDLIAIPWVDDPNPEVQLIKAIHTYLCGFSYADGCEKEGYHFSVLPGGRKSYAINLFRGGYFIGRDEQGVKQYAEDPEYYLDISITPAIKY